MAPVADFGWSFSLAGLQVWLSKTERLLIFGDLDKYTNAFRRMSLQYRNICASSFVSVLSLDLFLQNSEQKCRHEHYVSSKESKYFHKIKFLEVIIVDSSW